MSLNRLRQRFVAEYMVDLNATQAAIRAGYSPKTASQQGHQLLAVPEIQAAIESAAAARSARTEITMDRVVLELARVGLADIRKIVRWTSNVAGVVENPDSGEEEFRHFNDVELVNSADLDDDTAAAIAEISMAKDGALKIKMHGKLRALVELRRHLMPVERRSAGQEPGANAPPPDGQAEADDDFARILN